jgi:hypothetical protein
MAVLLQVRYTGDRGAHPAPGSSTGIDEAVTDAMTSPHLALRT